VGHRDTCWPGSRCATPPRFTRSSKRFPGDQPYIIAEITARWNAPIVEGGAVFWAMPFALVADYFDILSE
jgi:hypothetical protein